MGTPLASWTKRLPRRPLCLPTPVTEELIHYHNYVSHTNTVHHNGKMLRLHGKNTYLSINLQ